MAKSRSIVRQTYQPISTNAANPREYEWLTIATPFSQALSSFHPQVKAFLIAQGLLARGTVLTRQEINGHLGSLPTGFHY